MKKNTFIQTDILLVKFVLLDQSLRDINTLSLKQWNNGKQFFRALLLLLAVTLT